MNLDLKKLDMQAIQAQFQNLGNDPGTWPVVPRVAACIGAFVLIVFLGWYLLWSPEQEALSDGEAREAQLKDDLTTKMRQAANKDLYAERLKELNVAFGALMKQLPGKMDVENLLTDITQSGQAQGLEFSAFTPADKEISHEFYVELPVSVTVRGTYHDMGRFFEAIAKMPRIVALSDLTITPWNKGKNSKNPQFGASGPDTLEMTMKINVFRYLTEEEAQEQRAATKKKGGK
ncbi:MAG: type 4a pilus biogenesis protein PilO [Zoogloeaceae bacterium]|jgi:type IV pilus assembly protein PilO|nr:type 4a pilus biogenesis protein PilO [Zoogloeaceae bacterium]